LSNFDVCDWTSRPAGLHSWHDDPRIAPGEPMKNIPAILDTYSQPVPARWRKEVERVLISEKQLARRVRELAVEVERDFRRGEMVVVSLLNGTVMFLADLIRHLSLPMRLDFIGVSSYGEGTESGELVFTKELRLDVRGRDVLLVDDILDTGKTINRVLLKLRALKPRQIKVCVLLDKTARRVEPAQPDYTGFQIPDFFVVGYGLDFAERYRNLPFVGVLHPKVYQVASRKAIKSKSPKAAAPAQ
jgi:hypoxanthine phosphoribosyltransferase